MQKAHTETESVITPALAIVVEIILGLNAIEKVMVPLSNNTIVCRIEDLPVLAGIQPAELH